MNLILNIVFLTLAAILLIYSLSNINKKKHDFQKYPDSIKKDFYSQIRFISILNYMSVIILFVSALLMKSNLFFVFLILSSLISITSISYLEEDFDSLNDNNV